MTSSFEERRQIDLALADWLAKRGGLDGARYEAAFRHWLDQDPAHRAAYVAFRASDAEVGLTSLPIPPLHPPAAAGRAHRRLPLFVAGLAALAACGASLFYLAHPPIPSTATGTLYAAADTPRAVDLTAGPGVMLDAHALIRAAYAGPDGIVTLLDGRARFDVPAALGDRFVVAAGDLRLTAHGAVFDVGLGPQGVSVTPLDGVVLIERQGDGRGAPSMPIRIGRGRQLVVDGGGMRTTAAPNDEPAWSDALLPLDGRTLGEVVALGNRSGGKPIILDDPSLSARRIQGQLRASDTGTLARQLAAAFDLDLQDTQGAHRLRKK